MKFEKVFGARRTAAMSALTNDLFAAMDETCRRAVERQNNRLAGENGASANLKVTVDAGKQIVLCKPKQRLNELRQDRFATSCNKFKMVKNNWLSVVLMTIFVVSCGSLAAAQTGGVASVHKLKINKARQTRSEKNIKQKNINEDASNSNLSDSVEAALPGEIKISAAQFKKLDVYKSDFSAPSFTILTLISAMLRKDKATVIKGIAQNISGEFGEFTPASKEDWLIEKDAKDKQAFLSGSVQLNQSFRLKIEIADKTNKLYLIKYGLVEISSGAEMMNDFVKEGNDWKITYASGINR